MAQEERVPAAGSAVMWATDEQQSTQAIQLTRGLVRET